MKKAILVILLTAPVFGIAGNRQTPVQNPANYQVKVSAVKQPNFSGTWQLDTAASKFNGIPAASAAATELSFSQQEKFIAYGKLAKGADGTIDYFRDTVSFDGKPSVKVIPNTGDNKYTKTTTVKLANEGSLVFSASYKVGMPDGSEQFYSATETYSLSADGNTLTLQRSTILPDRTESITAVYHKIKS